MSQSVSGEGKDLHTGEKGRLRRGAQGNLGGSVSLELRVTRGELRLRGRSEGLPNSLLVSLSQGLPGRRRSDGTV